MAYRLRSAIALGIVALVACGAVGEAAPEAVPSNVEILRTATRVASNALGRYYEIANVGATEAFVVRALTDGRPIGSSEHCRLPNGSASTRPTVLANPLLAPSSIGQRVAIVAAIGAYEVARAARASAAPDEVVDRADRELHIELERLHVAANQHAQGDLFIEDLSASLTRTLERGEIASVGVTRSDRDATAIVVRALLRVLSTDNARQRFDTIDATALAYREWLRYAASLEHPPAPPSAPPDPPFCSEPVIFSRDHISTRTGATARIVDVKIRDRAARARNRLEVARAVNPASITAALQTLEADLAPESLTTGTPAALDVATETIERFRIKSAGVANALNDFDRDR